MRNDVKSRRYWLRGGILRVPGTGRPPGWLTGPGGWYLGAVPAAVPNPVIPGPLPPGTPHCGVRSGMLPSLPSSGDLLAAARWVGITLPQPTQLPVVPSWSQCSLHVHSARYSAFEVTVGEPRGSRTHPGYQSQAGYIQLFEILQVYTAV